MSLESLPSGVVWNVTKFLYIREQVRLASTCRELYESCQPQEDFPSQAKRLCFCRRGWCDFLTSKCIYCEVIPVIPTKPLKNPSNMTIHEFNVLAWGLALTRKRDDLKTDVYGNLKNVRDLGFETFDTLTLRNQIKLVLFLEHMNPWFPMITIDTKRNNPNESVQLFWQERSLFEGGLEDFKRDHPSDFWSLGHAELISRTKVSHFLFRPAKKIERMLETGPSENDMVLLFGMLKNEMTELLGSHYSNIHFCLSDPSD